MVKSESTPLMQPHRRRMQTFSVGVFILFLFGFGILSYLFCFLILIFGNIYLRSIVVVYAVWIYFDRDRAQNSIRGSGLRWMRDNFLWRQFRDYFPVELVKTAELPPNRHYILACFPHGVISIGLFTNMCADICKWNELFPKVRVHLTTLAMHFNTPIWRHFIQSWAMISVTKRSLMNNLTTAHDPQDPINADGYTASAIGLIVGGAQEALDARPGKYIITVKNRKGFIKLAMKSGAAIVPVISFGEVDIYDQMDNPPDSFLRKFQTFVKDAIGISPLFLIGRGFFCDTTGGLLPFRRRIVQVVGAPIDVQQSDNPTEDEINNLHEYFMNSLATLFDTHKAEYVENSESVELIMN